MIAQKANQSSYVHSVHIKRLIWLASCGEKGYQTLMPLLNKSIGTMHSAYTPLLLVLKITHSCCVISIWFGRVNTRQQDRVFLGYFLFPRIKLFQISSEFILISLNLLMKLSKFGSIHDWAYQLSLVTMDLACNISMYICYLALLPLKFNYCHFRKISCFPNKHGETCLWISIWQELLVVQSNSCLWAGNSDISK